MPIEPDTINTPQQDFEMLRTILAGTVDSQCPGGSFAHANSTQSCPLGKPFFRRGGCVLKTAHHFVIANTTGFSG
jgi:hypothetical protein